MSRSGKRQQEESDDEATPFSRLLGRLVSWKRCIQMEWSKALWEAWVFLSRGFE